MPTETAAPPVPSLPPGPSWPVGYSTAAWVARPWATLRRLRDTYGDTFTFRLANEKPWVFLTDPEHVKQVFTGDPRLLHAGEANSILMPVLGSHSVLLLDDARHIGQRKLLLPPFHGERMKQYGEIMDQAAASEIERWPAGEPFELAPRMASVTLEVIMRAVFGIQERENARFERLGTMLRELLDLLGSPRSFAVPILLGPDRAARMLRKELRPIDEAIFELIDERRRDPGLAEREDILSLLLEARHEDGSPMSNVELRDELMTLLVAGHETTATALSWAFERLARNPAALSRLEDEVAAGEDAYLDAVITEALRLRPVISIVLRRLTAPMEIAGHELPAGVSVAPCIYLMHRREDIYPEADRFRPERFLETPPGTYTWIPFGGGVRRCIGASFALFEMKAVLRAVVSRARVIPAEPAPEASRRRAITHVPEHGARVRIERRSLGRSAAPSALEPEPAPLA
jgi:cytochrome P450